MFYKLTDDQLQELRSEVSGQFDQQWGRFLSIEREIAETDWCLRLGARSPTGESAEAARNRRKKLTGASRDVKLALQPIKERLNTIDQAMQVRREAAGLRELESRTIDERLRCLQATEQHLSDLRANLSRVEHDRDVARVRLDEARAAANEVFTSDAAVQEARATAFLTPSATAEDVLTGAELQHAAAKEKALRAAAALPTLESELSAADLTLSAWNAQIVEAETALQRAKIDIATYRFNESIRQIEGPLTELHKVDRNTARSLVDKLRHEGLTVVDARGWLSRPTWLDTFHTRNP